MGGLVAGTAVHAALAEYHIGLQQGVSASTARLHQVIQTAWAAKESKSKVCYKAGETKEECIAKAIHLVEMYLEEPPPQGIIGVEKEFRAEISNSQGEYLKLPLVAMMDLVTENDGKRTVIDFKTSSRAYTPLETDLSLQLTCYAHVIHEETGVVPDLEYTVLIKTKTPKIQHLATKRERDEFGRLGDMLQLVQGGIEREAFYPIENPMNCSGCPFRKPCREWGISLLTLEPLAEGSGHVG